MFPIRAHALVPLCVAGTLLFSAGGSPALAQGASDSDWSVTLGAIGGFSPEYEGAKKLEFGGLPLVDITWRDRVFLSTSLGLGAFLWADEQFRFGLSVAPSSGRDEKDGRRLRGMGDIDVTAQGRMFAAYSYEMLTFSALVARDFGSSNGLTATLGAEATLPLSEQFSLSAATSGTWADEKHMETFFGVSAEQSRRSGLSRYKPESGFKSWDVSLTANYAITENWNFSLGGNVAFLVGDARKSPIVEKSTQFSAIAAISYSF
jgi:outer membrane scaffolding protein for murein synthesis (MipA/OmpV family)